MTKLFLSVNPVVRINPVENAILLSPFEMTCVANLYPKVVSQFVRYMVLEWVGPDGETLDSGNDNIVVKNQQTLYNTVVQSLYIKSVNMSDSGNYTCKAKLQLPDSEQTFTATTSYYVVARSKSS